LPGHWPEAELSLRRGGKVMHFRLVRAGEPLRAASTPDAADLAMSAASPATAPPGAPASSVLQVGEWLDWPALGPSSHFTVPLPAKALRP
jgi:hypothetical protein